MKKAISSLPQFEDALIVVIGSVLALILRLLLRNFISADTQLSIFSWYDFIKSHGMWASLKFNFSDYNPPYLYLLVFSALLQSALGISRILAIKAIAILFDFIGAYLIAKIINLRFENRIVGYLGGILFLFMPTVFLNSAFWGQSDITYTVFLLATIYFLLQRRPYMAMFAFGLAISFKLQAIFFTPLLVLLFLWGELPVLSILSALSAYLLSLLPAWIMGRPLGDLLTIYVHQTDEYHYLTANAPTFLALIDNSVEAFFNPAGIVLAGGVLFVCIAALYKLRPRITPELLLSVATCSVLLTPYLLPKIHERYFYAAEVFSLVLVFYRPRTFIVPVFLQVIGLCTYYNYFFQVPLVPLHFLAFLMLIPIGITIFDLANYLSLDAAAPATK